MIDRVVSSVLHAVAVGLVVSSVALAGGNAHKTLAEEQFEGTVIRVDAKGGATIKTPEGQEYNVQTLGAQVDDTIDGMRRAARGGCAWKTGTYS